MPLAGFKPVIQAIKQLQTYALDCTATGNGHCPAYIYTVRVSGGHRESFCLEDVHSKDL
jgi:hypothetical protein